MDDDDLIAEIETTRPDEDAGWRAWLTVRRRDGYIAVQREEMSPIRARSIDPESGICIEDDILDAFIMSLQAAKALRT